MLYDFDRTWDRMNTNSLKYDFAVERGKHPDLTPLWVADMDFQTVPEVIEALKKAAEHGIFGYSETKQDYFNALHNWYQSRFDWNLEMNWLVKTPGVVFAIAAAIRAYTSKGDAVLIQRPVYYPFMHLVTTNGRKPVNNPLVYEKGKYHIDFEDFESKIVDNNVKLFILCSPHNPVGRVWSKEELLKMGEICIKHGVLVISDEIHADFTYPGHKHLVFSNVHTEFSNHSVICTAPSKSFNLAGLQVSNIFIPNASLRKIFTDEIKRTGYSQLNTLGLVACEAAYQYGAKWMDELNMYLWGNVDYIRGFLESHIPSVKLVSPEGTYLLWLDFQALGLTEEVLTELLESKARLWLSSGTSFGMEGKGFQRLNIGCPRSILQKAMTQLHSAMSS